MIVVALIAIITAIAIPAILNSRKASNEASAVASLRTLSTISNSYRTRFGTFADSLASISSAGYIDSTLGSGTKSGYTFVYAGNQFGWNVGADPAAPGQTGDRSFFIDESGVIRFSDSGLATSASQPID
jgi:Tfp pilus assembly protein PilE